MRAVVEAVAHPTSGARLSDLNLKEYKMNLLPIITAAIQLIIKIIDLLERMAMTIAI